MFHWDGKSNNNFNIEKGLKSDCINYREVIIVCTSILSRIILSRLIPLLEHQLSEGQCGSYQECKH